MYALANNTFVHGVGMENVKFYYTQSNIMECLNKKLDWG